MCYSVVPHLDSLFQEVHQSSTCCEYGLLIAHCCTLFWDLLSADEMHLSQQWLTHTREVGWEPSPLASKWDNWCNACSRAPPTHRIQLRLSDKQFWFSWNCDGFSTESLGKPLSCRQTEMVDHLKTKAISCLLASSSAPPCFSLLSRAPPQWSPCTRKLTTSCTSGKPNLRHLFTVWQGQFEVLNRQASLLH